MNKLIIALAALLAAFLLLMMARPAAAANCSSYPYTLTNGQTADATQVMANFANILSCANSNLAHNGANSDITSLSGLLTPLSASQGGTGQSTSIFSTANTWADTQIFSAINTQFAAATTSGPSINLAPGVAPTSPSNGDMWITSLGLYARINGATQLVTTGGTLHVRYQTASGVNNAEVLADTSWTQRLLGTTVTNTISGASLASNQISLPAGTYDVQVSSFTFLTGAGPGSVKHRLYNVTDGAALLYSEIASNAGSGSQMVAPLIGQFTISGAKTIELDTYIKNSSIQPHSNALSSPDGSPEVWTDVFIKRIG